MQESYTGFILYKIYSEHGLLYLGHTNEALEKSLYGHFFKVPEYRSIDLECVTGIEYAYCDTQADLEVFFTYEINRWKPALNQSHKAPDDLTLELSEPEWKKYQEPILEEWREQLWRRNKGNMQRQAVKEQLEAERQEYYKEIAQRPDLTESEKQELIRQWLLETYEPVRNALL